MPTMRKVTLHLTFMREVSFLWFVPRSGLNVLGKGQSVGIFVE